MTWFGLDESYRQLLSKGAHRQVQGGALAPPGFCISVFCRPLSVHTIAQSLTQKHRQTLFYKVKYDIRCGCSKVDTRQICLQLLINLWVCTHWKKSCGRPCYSEMKMVNYPH